MKDYVDARDDAIESRLIARLSSIETKLDHTLKTPTFLWGLAGAVAAIVTLLLGVFSWGASQYDAGAALSPTIARMQAEQQKRDQSQDAQIKGMDGKLDVLIHQTAKK